jgi:hypothetical protein
MCTSFSVISVALTLEAQRAIKTSPLSVSPKRATFLNSAGGGQGFAVGQRLVNSLLNSFGIVVRFEKLSQLLKFL